MDPSKSTVVSPDPSTIWEQNDSNSAIVSPADPSTFCEKLPTLEQMLAEVAELEGDEDDAAAKNFVGGAKKREQALQDEAEEMVYRLEHAMTEDICDENMEALSSAMKAIEEAVKNVRVLLESAEALMERIEKAVYP